METFNRLLSMAKQYYVRFIFAAICMIIAGGSQSALPLIAKPAIDQIFFNKDTAALKWIPLAVVAIFLFQGIGQLRAGRFNGFHRLAYYYGFAQ